MSIEWTSRQLSRIERLVKQPTAANPRPQGQVLPGKTSAVVLAYLQQHPDRAFLRRHLIVVTGKPRKAVDWALIYLAAIGLIEAVPAGEWTDSAGAANPQARYRVRRQGRR